MSIIIYTLTDPFTKQVRYVGKTTSKNYRNRNKAHNNPHQRADKNPHKYNWLKSIISRGGKPIMEPLEVIEGEWEWVEKYWISQFRQWGYNLVNKSQGGDNPPPNTGWTMKQRIDLRKNNKYKRTLSVKTIEGEDIGVFESVSEFIRSYIGIDRDTNSSGYRLWSSKISAVANKKPGRKSYKSMVYEYI